MSLAMEKTPRVFVNLGEELIRDFFLIMLNGHYEGTASGETFNGEGKTDIIIKHKSDNVFIAECKEWKGKKSLLNATDQLLGYVTLRDTKTALIIFIRGTDFSLVTKQITEIIKSHNNYISNNLVFTKVELKKEVDRGFIFGFIFSNPKDKEKELCLTVMLFQAPEKDKFT
jgi:hypothetical protein